MTKSNSLILFLAVLLSGCVTAASIESMLQRETAISIANNVAPNQISISETNIARLEGTVTWTAAAPIGNFDCSGLQDGEGRIGVTHVLCIKK